jgi:Na+(H+)/acetate symporter ActP
MSDEQPGARLRRWLKQRAASPPVDASPISAWDYLVQQRLEEIRNEIAELKRLILGLIAAIMTAVTVSVIAGLLK